MTQQDFDEFLMTSSPALRRTAVLLTGNRDTADDLVQEALARAYRAWHRIDEHPEAYVKSIMVHLQAAWWRRRWRGEIPTENLPERPAGGADVVTRLTLSRALAQLPVGQRQIVVLRYIEDMSVDEVARMLDKSSGTVKSQAAKGLAKLRAILNEPGGDNE